MKDFFKQSDLPFVGKGLYCVTPKMRIAKVEGLRYDDDEKDFILEVKPLPNVIAGVRKYNFEEIEVIG